MVAEGKFLTQLAARLNVARQTIRDLEHNWAAGKITLESLNRLAAGLQCRVIYALGPERHLAEVRRERARQIAESLVKSVAHSMTLEAQSISAPEKQRQKAQAVQRLLQGNPKKLWE